MGGASTQPSLGLSDEGQALAPAHRRAEQESREVWELLAPGQSAAPPRSGVQALMLAVFEDAIRCYFRGEPRVRAEAEHWIEFGPRHWAFSFDGICECFGLDPAATRAALRRMRAVEPRPSMLRKRHRGTGRRAGVAVRRR